MENAHFGLRMIEFGPRSIVRKFDVVVTGFGKTEAGSGKVGVVADGVIAGGREDKLPRSFPLSIRGSITVSFQFHGKG